MVYDTLSVSPLVTALAELNAPADQIAPDVLATVVVGATPATLLIKMNTPLIVSEPVIENDCAVVRDNEPADAVPNWLLVVKSLRAEETADVDSFQLLPEADVAMFAAVLPATGAV